MEIKRLTTEGSTAAVIDHYASVHFKAKEYLATRLVESGFINYIYLLNSIVALEKAKIGTEDASSNK